MDDLHRTVQAWRIAEADGLEPLPGFPFVLDKTRLAGALAKAPRLSRAVRASSLSTEDYVASSLILAFAGGGADAVPGLSPACRGRIDERLAQLPQADRAYLAQHGLARR